MSTISQKQPSNPNTNNGAIVIQFILTKITDLDIQGVQDGLARLPLAVIPTESSDTLIAWFLTKCMETENIEAARLILETFDLNRISVDPLPAITQLFMNPNISHDVLLFAVHCFPEKQPLNYYNDLVNMNDDINALKAAARINTVFPDVSCEDWSLLYKLTESGDDEDEEDDQYHNPLLRCFFETKIAETGSFVSTPSWVKEYPVEDLIPVPDTVLNVKDAVDLLISDMKKQKLTIIAEDSGDSGEVDTVDIEHEPEVKEQLISQYSISTVMEKIQMLSHVKHIEPFNDIAIFREHGPVNTLYTVSSSSYDSDHPCSKFGGCRMFTCTEFENMRFDGEEIDIMAVDEYNDHVEYATISYKRDGSDESVTENIIVTNVGPSIIHYEWFRGSCDICLKRIARKHHAIRQPLCHGGWRGCYCSIDCMKQDITDPGCALMVGRMAEQLDVIGIRDRP